MTDERDPLDPALASLFAKERRRVPSPDVRTRVGTRLEASIRALPAPPAPDTPSTPEGSSSPGGGAPPVLGAAARLGPIVGAFVVGLGVGGAVVAGFLPKQVVYIDRPVDVSGAVAPAPVLPPEPPASVAPPDEPASPSPSASAPAASADPRPESTLAREREILDVARTAVGRGDGQHALSAVTRHQREFPRGQMAEEREALAVQALARLGRGPEATERAARFRRTYPNSVFLPVLDAALGAVGPDR